MTKVGDGNVAARSQRKSSVSAVHTGLGQLSSRNSNATGGMEMGG